VTGPRETERLLLRWFTLDDLDAFNELGTNPMIIRYVGSQPYASLDVAREKLAAAPLKDYATYGYCVFHSSRTPKSRHRGQRPGLWDGAKRRWGLKLMFS